MRALAPDFAFALDPVGAPDLALLPERVDALVFAFVLDLLAAPDFVLLFARVDALAFAPDTFFALERPVVEDLAFVLGRAFAVERVLARDFAPDFAVFVALAEARTLPLRNPTASSSSTRASSI